MGMPILLIEQMFLEVLQIAHLVDQRGQVRQVSVTDLFEILGVGVLPHKHMFEPFDLLKTFIYCDMNVLQGSGPEVDKVQIEGVEFHRLALDHLDQLQFCFSVGEYACVLQFALTLTEVLANLSLEPRILDYIDE